MTLFPLEQFVPFALVVCVGIFVQSVAGFAAGLIIVPLMLLAGHGIPEAQAALLVATIPQNILGVYRFRESIEWSSLRLPMVLRLVALPVGVMTLSAVDNFPVGVTRQIVGGVVIGCVVMLTMFRPTSRSNVHTGWTYLAFLSSGFFAGLTGTGGPMMVLWVQLHAWSTKQVRGFLFAMYLVSLPVILGLLYWAFPSRVAQATTSALALVPLLLLVTQAGLWVGTRLGRERLRSVTYMLLVILGLMSLLSPFFK